MNLLASPFIPFLLIQIGFIVVNAKIAVKKGKSPAFYGILSILPVVSLCFSIFLLSLVDKELKEKIDAMYEYILSQKK